jgi:acetyl esterase/lipase
VSIPALQVPSSNLMSQQGADSRVEHILTERSLKGKTVAEINVALFGPRAARTKAAFPVTIRDSTIGGVHVRTFEPRDGIAPAMRGRVLLHVHGGGFVGCFDECGALEAIPVAALAHVRVISIDYRIAPAAQYPAASEDVAAVYREVLKTIPARHIGLFGCSAGGTLTTQSLVWFQRHNLPTPAAAGVFCAGGDSSMGGDSQLIGMLLGDGEAPAPRSASGGSPQLGYMRGASTADAAAYPARDKAALAKFPPTLVIAGTRDFALSGAVNLHSKLVANGVDARLNVWEGGRHAFFYDVRVPEAREAYDVMAKFFTAHLR